MSEEGVLERSLEASKCKGALAGGAPGTHFAGPRGGGKHREAATQLCSCPPLSLDYPWPPSAAGQESWLSRTPARCHPGPLPLAPHGWQWQPSVSGPARGSRVFPVGGDGDLPAPVARWHSSCHAKRPPWGLHRCDTCHAPPPDPAGKAASWAGQLGA